MVRNRFGEICDHVAGDVDTNMGETQIERVKVNGNGIAYRSKLEARISEPFFAGTSAHEALDQPGFNMARRAWERDPAKYTLVARDLFDLYPPATVAKNHKVSVEVVRAIRNLYPELVQAGKLKLMANLEEASLLLSDRLVNEARRLDLSRVPAALSAIVEKLSLLSGGATIRTEHVERDKHVVSAEELKQMFVKLTNKEDHNAI